MTNDPLHVPANARETVWVFALDLPPADAEAVVEGGPGGNWPLKSLLGATNLRARHVESFPADDLKGIGLPSYLIDGLGIDEAHVEPDRAKLEAERQHIVILHAGAFDDAEQRLTPQLPLRHLGTYAQIQAEQRLVPMPSAETTPALPPTPGVPPAVHGSAKGGRGLLGLIAAALVVLLLAYFLSGSG